MRGTLVTLVSSRPVLFKSKMDFYRSVRSLEIFNMAERGSLNTAITGYESQQSKQSGSPEKENPPGHVEWLNGAGPLAMVRFFARLAENCLDKQRVKTRLERINARRLHKQRSVRTGSTVARRSCEMVNWKQVKERKERKGRNIWVYRFKGARLAYNGGLVAEVLARLWPSKMDSVRHSDARWNNIARTTVPYCWLILFFPLSFGEEKLNPLCVLEICCTCEWERQSCNRLF